MTNSRPGKRSQQKSAGRFAYEGLHRAIHEKARLGIMTSLATHPDGLLFADLKELCCLTDGNLNRHLQVLREAGLVEVWKGGQGRRSHTLCRITPDGQDQFLHYLAELEKVIADAATARSESAATPSALKGLSPA